MVKPALSHKLTVLCPGVVGCRPVTGAVRMSVSRPGYSLLRVPVSALTTRVTLTNTAALGKLRLGR